MNKNNSLKMFSPLISSVARAASVVIACIIMSAPLAVAAQTVGEYRFDDCGGAEWLNDYSINENTATGTKVVVQTDGKNYGCSSLSAFSSDVEVPHIPAYAMSEGAVSMLVYDHHNVWETARLLEKTDASSSERFDLRMKNVNGDIYKGTFSVHLNGNSIETGETFFNVTGDGSDFDTDWVHVMFTFGPQGMRLYVDGQLKGTNAYTGGFSNLDSAFKLPYFSGLYDEFYILEGQPSDAQVQTLHTNLLANKNINGSDRVCDCSNPFAAISGKVYLDENGNNQHDAVTGNSAGSLQSDLLLLYSFGTGSGNTVYDTSGVGSPMNLTIADTSKVGWLPGGGLSVHGSTILKSTADTKLTTALKASNEVTLEAWVKPANLTQDGPARIATFSKNTAHRNLTLGQEDDDYDFRLRTSTNNNNGSSPATAATGSVDTELQHVVYTRTAAGSARIYVDGVLAGSQAVGGNFNNMDSSHLFALANEVTADRPWLGEFYKVALYKRALDASEVSALFTEGSEPLLADVKVSLYNDNGTSSTTADDIFLESTSTAEDGFYEFYGVATGLTYRIEVDVADTDLPADASIGTPNPLTGVSVVEGVVSANRNFGFDLSVTAGVADYSDAPANGETAPDGASVTSYGVANHAVVAGILLGATITDETSAVEDADNASDDGISVPTLTKGLSKTLTATVSGSGGYLQGWIDWNGDGDFADSSEQVATDLQLASGSSGTISIPVTVPANAITGQTMARFRWSTVAGLNSIASAVNGEVEDYALTIAPLTIGKTPQVCTSGQGDYANWSGSTSGTGSFINSGGIVSVLPNFSYAVTGDDDGTSIDSSETFNGANQLEPIYGQADSEENLNVRVKPNTGSNGSPIQKSTLLTVTFDSVTPSSGWAFHLHDIDDDQAKITAKDANGNPVSIAEINSWVVELFDPNTSNGTQLAVWDSTHAAVVGAISSGVSSYRTTIRSSDIITEAPGIWFQPTMALSELSVQFESVIRSDASYHIYLASCVEQEPDDGDISGTVYTDSNSNDSYDSGSESGIGSVTVSLFNNSGGALISTTNTAANGAYSFSNLNPSLTYRIEVDTVDTDLAGKTIGTTNPLTGVVVTAGNTTANQNFGFDLPETSTLKAVGEYRFDDCGGAEWLNDYSIHANTATGTKVVVQDDDKNYACTSLSALSSAVEVPHIPAYAMTEGAVSMLVYDHHNVWATSRLLEKTDANGSDRFDLTMKRANGDSQQGTFSVNLNGNGIDTGETFFNVTGDGSDFDTDWVHVMFTFGPQGMRLYVDGQLKGTNAYTGGFSNLDSAFKLPYFSGLYDEFYILEGQPSDAQVQALHTNLLANKNINGSDRVCDCSSPFAAISGKVYLDENGNDQHDAVTGNNVSSLQNDLLLLYSFETGSGNTVYDTSGVGISMNLTIADTSKVDWLSGGGLSVHSSTILKSTANTKLTTALKASNELTLEAWIKPDNLTQNGPARIATLSNGTLLRNLTLGQEGDDYNFRLRTSTNDNNGSSPATSATGIVNTELQHVVYTRTAAGSARIYVDGVLAGSQSVGGDFSNLNSSFLFALANETTNDRPWLGEFYKVALYKRALSASEVSALFAEGSEPLLADVTVSLYNDNGTSSTTADDIFLESTSTGADGSYEFYGVATGLTYRVEVDAADTDLPTGASIGTPNPLTGVSVAAGTVSADRNFGFDVPTTYTNNYCVAPTGATGLLALGAMPTTAINGSGTFTYPDRVLPGYGTVDVTVNMTGGAHNASTSAIDNGGKQASWLDQGLTASGVSASAIYLEPNSSGTATVTYNFDQPTGNVDLLVLDVDYEDTLTITALDGAGNAITDFSGWRYRSGDMSIWQNPDPVDALPPAWNAATATLTSTDAGNDHRSFGLLTPDTLVTKIVVTFAVPAVAGRHVYTSLFTTASGRDGELVCSTVSDFGDAPASYGAASHVISTGLHLGQNPPSSETASKYSFNARADDNDDGAPRQPVTSYIPLFPVLQQTDTQYSAEFTVNNTIGAAAKLYGWIDFDKSGTFEADEGTFVSVPNGVNNGSVTLNWASIPTDIQLGTTAIRLRLTTDPAVTVNTPAGAAGNGEVEDFPIAIAMDIPANSPSISIVSGATPAACEVVIFIDDFNDLPPYKLWGANRADGQSIRDWNRAGGGADTYAQVKSTTAGGSNIYFGNGAVREISPPIPGGFTFDANGKLLTVIDAIALRDDMDDITPGVTDPNIGDESDWGPEPVTLSRTFATVVGQTYRLYFKASPEGAASSGDFVPGIMRLDMPGGSIHFKAPGSAEAVQQYAVEFTATSTSSTIAFLNYGHVLADDSGWCDPNSYYNNNPWCTVGGSNAGQGANELIIDDVVLTQAACATGTVSGTVYSDSNGNNIRDAGEPGITAISVSLYDDKGTPGNPADDRLVNTMSSNATGGYSFANVDAAKTYRVEVDVADSDLPSNVNIGTTNPLTGVSVSAGMTTSDQNFGFDPSIVADYSDAPANGETAPDGASVTSYGVAKHTMVAGILLGATITDETSAVEDADNASDDGISVPTLTQGLSKTLTAAVSGSGGYLQGWIDWNGDGDFADSGEQVATDLQLASGSSGTISIPVTVPANALTGQTMARFRWSTVAGLNSTASTMNGEVEDYALTIIPLTIGKTPQVCTSGQGDYANWSGNKSGTGSFINSGGIVSVLPNFSYAVTGDDDGTSIDSSETFNGANQLEPIYGQADSEENLNVRVKTNTGSNGSPIQKSTLLTVTFDSVTPSSGWAFHLHDIDDDQAKITAKDANGNPVSIAEINSWVVELFDPNISNGTQLAVWDSTHAAVVGAISSGVSSYRTTIRSSDIITEAPGIWFQPTMALSELSVQFESVIRSNASYHIYLASCVEQQQANGGISGTVYTDSNSNDSYDSGSESGIGSVTVSLFNNSGGALISTTNTAANGAYSFSNLNPSLTYRVEVDTADTDLAGKTIGTINPLTGVTVTAGNTTANQNFGFDPVREGGIPVCWAVDDDTANIYRFLPDTNNPQPPVLIPTARANNGEGLSWRPSTDELYMWDGDTTYVMDANTGADVRTFTAALSPGNHVEGSAFYIDPVTKQEELWLVVEDGDGSRRADRYLVRINPNTGAGITSVGPLTGGYMDSSVDYGKDTGGLAIDPNTKQFWITNDGLHRGVYPLNEVTGVVGSGTLFNPSKVDGEALEFADDGLFYTESDQGPSTDRYIWQVNGATGTIIRAAGPFPGVGDVEAVACNGGASVVVPTGCSLVVTTTNDSDSVDNDSGSLRDAIQCANATPGADTISFNMPATEAGFTNPAGANNDYWSILLSSPLPNITDAVTIDGRTQTTNKGNTNSGDIAAATTVGVDNMPLPAVAAPEVEIVGQTSFAAGLNIKADNVSIYGLGLRRFDSAIRIDQTNTSGVLISGVAFGVDPVSGVDPGAGQRSNQHIGVEANANNVSFTLNNSVLGYNDTKRGIFTDGIANLEATIHNNHFVGIGMAGNTTNAAIQFLHTQSPVVVITENSFAGRGAGVASDVGVEFNDVGGGNTALHLENNTVSGFRVGINYLVQAVTHDLLINKNQVFGNTESALSFDRIKNAMVSLNHLYDNGKHGVLINSNNSRSNVVTQNSIYNNGEAGINLVGGNQIDPGGITLNDANDGDTGPNTLLNFPVLSRVSTAGANLVLEGCAPAGALIEFFEADVSSGGAATSGDNQFGLSKDYGEGQTYLFSLTEGGTADADSSACGIAGEDGNSHTGMKGFSFSLPVPAGVSTGDMLTATATLSGSGTSEFGPVAAVAAHAITGHIFEDYGYGGGAGRSYSASGSIGAAGVTVEIYDDSGVYLAAVGTDAEGIYQLPDLVAGSYYVRVVNESVTSGRGGSDGSEVAIMTYRSDGITAVTNEVGGRNPGVADAGANEGSSQLNTTDFTFTGGNLDGGQAQSVQPVTVSGSDVRNADFGFNFNTIVNTNNGGQGSLQQFVYNNNLLSHAGTQQSLPALFAGDYSADDTVAVFMVPVSLLVNGEAEITPEAELRIEQPRIVIDGRVQLANIGNGDIVIKGDGASFAGVYFDENAGGSVLREVTVSGFAGSGINIYGAGAADADGVTVRSVAIRDNGEYGVFLQNSAAGNQIVQSTIADNGYAGIANDAASNNTFSQNSISDNGALGIDLGSDGVTENSNSDGWLNYPELDSGSSISTNGTKIVAYDFDLDVPANTHGYRVEFFSNTVVDASLHGEGENYLGHIDVAHPGTGSKNFKGSLNANQAVPENANIALTLTEKLGVATLGSTSEFTRVRNGKLFVCTDLLADPNAEMVDIVLNENSSDIVYLEALDADGNPVTYTISGGVDGNRFVIDQAAPDALFDCVTVRFINNPIIDNRALPTVKAGSYQQPPPGNYEAPVDNGNDNIYDLQITATDSQGNTVTKPLSVIIRDVNEKPVITSAALVDFLERQDTSTVVMDLESYDPDAGDAEGSGLTYSISGGADGRHFNVDAQSGELRFVDSPDYGAPADKNGDNKYELEVRVMDDQGYSGRKSLTVTVTDDPDKGGVRVNIAALLQGSYDWNAGLMVDNLRSLNLLPLNQPYAAEPFNYQGTETLSAANIGLSGDEAIVDWVLVELRNSADPTQVVAATAALLRRNGNVADVSLNGSGLTFEDVTPGQYYVSLRHRNHLDVMTAVPLSLSMSPVLVDFSDADTPVYGEHARLSDGDIAMLWSGDINQDNRLILSGQGSDLNSLLTAVLIAPDNAGFNSSYQVPGYNAADLNMDGKVVFMGPSNDANILLGNTLAHPGNPDFSGNFIAVGGMP